MISFHTHNVVIMLLYSSKSMKACHASTKQDQSITDVIILCYPEILYIQCTHIFSITTS